MEYLIVNSLFISIVIGCSSALSGFEGTFKERFSYYETLHHSSINIQHTVKRSVDSESLNERIVSFSTLGKHFKLHLETEIGLFSPDFVAIALDVGDVSRKLDVDTREFYKGYVEGDPESIVHAHWDGNDLSATVKTKDDVYVVEPSWGYLARSSKFSMISYRMSDMRERATEDLGKSYCGYVHPDENRDDAAADHYLTLKQNSTETEFESRRTKRQSANKKVCRVALVADYHYYQNVGQSSTTTTTNAMVSALTKANDIFKQSSFGANMGTGFEMQIKEIIINTAATAVTNGNLHYNMPVSSGSSWDVTTLLKEFSKQDWSSVCVAHLYTHLDFNDGVLGLGWIASNQPGTTGGICSQVSGGFYYNTAFSSTMNSGGNRLSTLEANLVLTHEFGHNWGSPHDPGSCAPSVASGGKYLMYQYSVNGYDSNNLRFSDCSLNSIGAVLKAKKDICFIDSNAVVCGNGVVETGEQCDGAAAMLADTDPCCTKSCRFRAKYRCSDYNDICCSSCQYAGILKQCRFSGQFTSSCQVDTFCDGNGPTCPAATNKADGTTCGDQGACASGVCQSFCEKNGLIDCECGETSLTCKRCCKTATGSCTAYDTGAGVFVNHENGKPCSIGFCETGVCKRQILNINQRTWDVIANIKRNGLLEFMKSNIVLTVVVITLVIYIPIVIVVLCIDWKNDSKEDDIREWHHRENDKLVRDDADTVIRPTYTRRRANRIGGGGTVTGSMASESGVLVGNM